MAGRTIGFLLAIWLSFSHLPAGAEQREPWIVAHRGLLRHAPENALANFRACLELRLGFEFDVEQTMDGHLVCIHDSTVDRTTDGTGPPRQQIERVRSAGKRAFIAGVTVSGNVPDNWQQAAQVGISAILTDYPLELRQSLRQAAK